MIDAGHNNLRIFVSLNLYSFWNNLNQFLRSLFKFIRVSLIHSCFRKVNLYLIQRLNHKELSYNIVLINIFYLVRVYDYRKMSHKLGLQRILQVEETHDDHSLTPLFLSRSFPPSVWMIASKSLISLSRLDICSCIPRSSSMCSLKTSETNNLVLSNQTKEHQTRTGALTTKQGLW